MKNNNKLVNKTIELSLLKFVSAGGKGTIYLPPNIQSCSVIAAHVMSPGE
ncbi:hypothetical protein SG34_004510 [Thalassomonas viridans]|uniref:Uncharacterized protein n=1 Tax=Thalassomonas viridans TaxID=137584 RepID=A0AAE9Z421_9GAMM|nr:hypothetical protein [Thalassomonas viridans]WDE06198.1 hypothetical protein SG34_004510 [Thalassomonas viridans]